MHTQKAMCGPKAQQAKAPRCTLGWSGPAPSGSMYDVLVQDAEENIYITEAFGGDAARGLYSRVESDNEPSGMSKRGQIC